MSRGLLLKLTVAEHAERPHTLFSIQTVSENMVTPTHRRIRKYAEGLNPLVVYLYVKKQRNQGDLIIGVQTEKDMAINPILIPYNLDARLNVLALMAWRELYYMRYKSKQKVVLNE